MDGTGDVCCSATSTEMREVFVELPVERDQCRENRRNRLLRRRNCRRARLGGLIGSGWIACRPPLPTTGPDTPALPPWARRAQTCIARPCRVHHPACATA